MVIDLILDRKDGIPYNAHGFYIDCLRYGEVADEITRAMDCGTENDVRFALCRYILQNGYNPQICGYVRTVDWL